jgi:dihydrofolate reductase
VFTHRYRRFVAGAEVRFVSGVGAEVHAAMVAAAGDGDRWIVGGGDLVGQFDDAGLLDEVIVSAAPVFLGGGAPLLPRRISAERLELVSVKRAGQFACSHYRIRK